MIMTYVKGDRRSLIRSAVVDGFLRSDSLSLSESALLTNCLISHCAANFTTTLQLIQLRRFICLHHLYQWPVWWLHGVNAPRFLSAVLSPIRHRKPFDVTYVSSKSAIKPVHVFLLCCRSYYRCNWLRCHRAPPRLRRFSLKHMY